jgi:hypothetical protein
MVGLSSCSLGERDAGGTTSVKVEHSRGALSKLLKRYRRDPSQSANTRISFPNDVCTAFRSHPDFVHATSIHVNSITHTVCLLLRISLLRIGNRKLSFEDQMRGQALVRVRAVMGVSCGEIVSPVSWQ